MFGVNGSLTFVCEKLSTAKTDELGTSIHMYVHTNM